MIEIVSRIASGLLLLLILAACDTSSTTSSASAPLSATYVAPSSCRQCHVEESAQWAASDHAKAMQLARPKTVLGNFNNASFSSRRVTAHFFKRDGRYMVNTEDADGHLKDFEIRYTFGIYPLQQYMIDFSDGSKHLLDIAWDARTAASGGQRWFSLHPNENITPRDPLHWTGRFLNWNYMCAECHSTNLRTRFDVKTHRYRTTWSGINVNCQACHGPGSRHIQWANSPGSRIPDKGLTVPLWKSAKAEVESCAACHALRHSLQTPIKPGATFLNQFTPQLLTAPFYYPDGQIRGEDYVYGSFVQSKMFARGIRCSDCHNAHSAKLKLNGNSLCISCHNGTAEQRFAGLKHKNYDSPEHHFHKAGSPAASCVACHMPGKLYMGVDLRHDHGFRIPRPDLSIKTGAPNACTSCHKGKHDAWAVAALAKWYPDSMRRWKTERNFSEVFAAAQRNGSASLQDLSAIANARQDPPIIRATAVQLMAGLPKPETVDALASLIADPEPLVRMQAAESLAEMVTPLAGEALQRRKAGLLLRLLDDKLRAVRMQAAFGLSDVPAALRAGHETSYKRALNEYIANQQEQGDHPEAHFNLALLNQRMGNLEGALSEYELATSVGPDFIPAYYNLVSLYNRAGNRQGARDTLNRLLSVNPDDGEAYYLLGLLLTEMKLHREAQSYLDRAAALLPERQDIRLAQARLRAHHKPGLRD